MEEGEALLFVTINDWPTLSNLSGQSNKGYNACTHCFDDIKGIFLKKCRKVVYLGHRRFLPVNHPLRKKGKYFKGTVDHQTKLSNRTGEDVLNMEGCESSIWKGTWQRTCSERCRQSRTHVEEVHIFGATLLASPRGL